MRAILATDYGGQLRKLIWFTENKTGISAGICDKKANPHATYHVDGAYHHKITSRGRIIKVAPEKKRPLLSIADKEQLLGTAAFYDGAIMNRLPRFTPDGRATTVIVLGQSVFSNIRCAAFNSHILHRDYEEAFLIDAYSSYEDGSFMLVAVNVFALDLFPDHKVGVVVYKGRGASEQSMPLRPSN